jgi:predicted PurR-regulated permease PerM
MKTYKLPFYIRYTIVLISLVFTVIVMREASTLLIPLFAGLLLAILLLPLVKVLERARVPSALACLLAVLCFVILFVCINYFLTMQMLRFLRELPDINAKILGLITSSEQWITAKFNIDDAHQSDYLGNSSKDIVAGITGMAKKIFISLANMIAWILFVCVYAFFILFYRRLLLRFVTRLAVDDFPTETPAIISEQGSVIKNYISGLLIKFVIVLVLNSAVLLIIGVKYALLLAIIASLLSFIPYLGFFIAIILAMLVTYANSQGSTAMTVGIVMIAIHIIDGIILLPRIVGGSMKMNPFITIIAVIAGDIIWGVPGMFLFIPLAAMCKIVFDNIPSLEAWGILFGEEGRKKMQGT